MGRPRSKETSVLGWRRSIDYSFICYDLPRCSTGTLYCAGICRVTRNLMDKQAKQPESTRCALQGGRRRLIVPAPLATLGTGQPEVELQLLAQLGPDTVFMMGDNPALPQ